MACRAGNAGALAECIAAMLYGRHNYVINHEPAHGYPNRLGANDRPGARTLLTRVYRSGLAVQLATGTALALTAPNKAA